MSSGDPLDAVAHAVLSGAEPDAALGHGGLKGSQ
jgi:hypothetical protein